VISRLFGADTGGGDDGVSVVGLALYDDNWLAFWGRGSCWGFSDPKAALNSLSVNFWWADRVTNNTLDGEAHLNDVLNKAKGSVK
jgi:hypothetical protein